MVGSDIGRSKVAQQLSNFYRSDFVLLPFVEGSKLVLVVLAPSKNSVELFGQHRKDDENEDISADVLYIIESACIAEGVPFDEENIEADMHINFDVENEVDVLAMMCLVAEQIALGYNSSEVARNFVFEKENRFSGVRKHVARMLIEFADCCL